MTRSTLLFLVCLLTLPAFAASNIESDPFDVGDIWVYRETSLDRCCNLDATYFSYRAYRGIKEIRIISKYVESDYTWYVCSIRDSGVHENGNRNFLTSTDTTKDSSVSDSTFTKNIWRSPFSPKSGLFPTPDSARQLVAYHGDTLLLEGTMNCGSAIYSRSAYLEKIGLIRFCREDLTQEWHVGSQLMLLSCRGIPFDSSAIIPLKIPVPLFPQKDEKPSMTFAVKLYSDCIAISNYSLPANATISIFNAASQLVFSRAVPISNRLAFSKRLPPGVYIVTIASSKDRRVFRTVLAK
jgi:hypothetical protein